MDRGSMLALIVAQDNTCDHVCGILASRPCYRRRPLPEGANCSRPGFTGLRVPLIRYDLVSGSARSRRPTADLPRGAPRVAQAKKCLDDAMNSSIMSTILL